MPYRDSKRLNEAALDAEMFQRVPHINRLGDQPIEEQYRAQMAAMAKALNAFLNGDAPPDKREIGFILLVFPFGERAGRCNYMSNGADRRDVVTMLKEQIRRFEGAPDVQGTA